ncbi:MAG: hypothetical protein IJM15_00485, partial [Erysipelotrichaceae bacterium]|nr:hypothetical protein [Erysipelotrichaceae bacterium]
DLYDGQQLFSSGNRLEGSRLFLIHYPDGRIIQPIEKKDNVLLTLPIIIDDLFVFLKADFNDSTVSICSFSLITEKLRIIETFGFEQIGSFYNLLLRGTPLLLYRQQNNTFRAFWPVQSEFETEPSESLNFRDGDLLYFTSWVEDPEYREFTVVRDIHAGNIIEKMDGDIRIMPNGEKWRIY